MPVAIPVERAQAFAAAFTPDAIDSLVAIYRQAAADVLQILARASSTAAQRIRARALLIQYHEILAGLDDEAAAWISTNLPLNYQAGITFADQEMRRLRRVGINTRPTKPQVFALVNREAVALAVQEMQRTLLFANAEIGRRVDDLFRRVGIEATAKGIAEGWTRIETSTEIKEQLVSKGRLLFTDRLGRDWDLDRYTEMVARTTTRQANVQGTVDRLLDHGVQLAQVSAHGAADFCRYYENVVVSLTGEPLDGYPPLSAINGGPPFHPNCRHVLRPFVMRYKSAAQRKAGFVKDPSILDQSPAELQRRFRSAFPGVAKAERERLVQQAAEGRARLERRAAREQRTLVGRITALSPREVVSIGNLPPQVAQRFEAGKTGVVLTGERREHYLTMHPDVKEVEHLLPELLSNPTAVFPNRADPNVAIFYLQEEDRYLRAAVIVSREEGETQNSIASLRYARQKEFERDESRAKG